MGFCGTHKNWAFREDITFFNKKLSFDREFLVFKVYLNSRSDGISSRTSYSFMSAPVVTRTIVDSALQGVISKRASNYFPRMIWRNISVNLPPLLSEDSEFHTRRRGILCLHTILDVNRCLSRPWIMTTNP